MMDKIKNAEIYNIDFQSDVDSFPLRENFNILKNKTNEVIDGLASVSIGTTNAETTAARPYHTSIKERLDSMNTGINRMKTGGAVTMTGAQQATAAAGEALIKGIDVKFALAVFSSIPFAPSGQVRYDVIVVNSDNTVSRVAGTASATAVLPAVSVTQRPLAVLTCTNSNITAADAREQGVIYKKGGELKWAWLLGGAISDKGTEDGDFFIYKGNYREAEIVHLNTNYQAFYFDSGAVFNSRGGANAIFTIGVRKKLTGGRFIGSGGKYTIRMQNNDIAIKSCIISGGNAAHRDLVLNGAENATVSDVYAEHVEISSGNNVDAQFTNSLTSLPSFSGTTEYYFTDGAQIITDRGLNTIKLNAINEQIINAGVVIEDYVIKDGSTQHYFTINNAGFGKGFGFDDVVITFTGVNLDGGGAGTSVNLQINNRYRELYITSISVLISNIRYPINHKNSATKATCDYVVNKSGVAPNERTSSISILKYANTFFDDNNINNATVEVIARGVL